MLLRLVVLLFISPSALPVSAEEIRIATASNFALPLRDLANRFEERSDHKVTLALGSTGKHYAQIRLGAPFHLFFAADAERPERLEQEGFTLPNTRFSYAWGKLILWSPQPDVVDSQGNVLETMDFRHLAIANPRLAPYGRAAEEILRARGSWEDLQKRLVRGENISQAFHFVHGEHAELGFVALSQVQERAGSRWIPPDDLYAPIEQQAVQLRAHPGAEAFLTFIRGEEAKACIQSYGYGTQ
ncbi:MAG: molybdate ABC transporter substrate-binding protein [Verrucomicrobiota bacterium]